MAHTTIIADTCFVHNSDMSGDVTISNDNGEFNVNGNDLVNFVLEHLRDKKIMQLEQMDGEELKNDFLKLL